MQYLDVIVKSGLFQKINKSEREKALKTLFVTERKGEKGSVLFYEGDDMEWIGILKKGIVRGEKYYWNGDKNILQIVDVGEIFALDGISSYGTAAMSYVCQEDCEILLVSLRSLLQSKYCKEMLHMLMQKLEDDHIRQMHQIEILSRKGIRDRIMTFFEIRREKEKSNQIYLRMNRQQLAEHLCVNRTVLSNELSKMSKEGMIELDKSKITLKY